ncbi:MAG: PAS domain-containing protein [Gammaproteobacteria bacterium]|nr:PAS domain-containing protein [Gammaproteobacteria bacterium]MCH9763768.1 PAS domain-containing protein [Gammaproteobacteria bacterium]
MTGYGSGEIIDKNCRFLKAPGLSQPHIEIIHKALDNSTGCRVLLQNKKKDGTLFWNELNLTPIKNSQGVVTHYVGIQKDVTVQEESVKKT